MSSDTLSHLEGHKYINVETYRKSGQAVRTPVWFVMFDGQIFVMTTESTGKVKRIKNNADVKIAPCGMRGELKGPWISARARLASEQEAQKAIQMRNKKYGFRAKIVGMFIKKDRPAVIAISA